MTVMLMTGATGSGKTAHVVDMLAHDDQFKGRPLFVMGIPELLIDHQPTPPVAEWTELRTSPEDETLKLPYFVFPANSVIVIDEAQRVFRPRPVGSKVPPEVQAFETHRHTGVDFILITQSPGLIDSNVRKLIRRHWHIHETPLKNYLLEWPTLGDIDSKTEREIAVRTAYKPPKRVFGLYKSAEAHTTIKKRIPGYVYLVVVAGISATVLGGYAMTRVKERTTGGELVKESPGPTSNSGSSAAKADKLTLSEYYAESSPRLPGLHHTAPRYDEITKPNDAPWPTGCLIRASSKTEPERCRCIDQQGNTYATTPSVCKDIVHNGIFKDWQGPERQREHEKPRQTAQPAGVASPVPPAAQPAPAVMPAPQMQAAVEPPGNPRPIPADSPWRFKG